MKVENVNYKILKVADLSPFMIRDIRPHVVEKIKKNIKENGYFEARVLAVIKNGDLYQVADGNHRLQALKELGIETVPCILYENDDAYKIAVRGNQAENTFAPLDLFDWLSIISKLKDDGLTLKEIGEKINQSEGWIKKHSMLLSNIVPNALIYCKMYQIGRGTNEVPLGTFDFTERWFRDSGLYDLCENYQLECLEAFVNDKCNWSKQKLQSETSKYKKWQEYAKTAESKLVDVDNLENILSLIENNTFKNEGQLLSKIDDLNKESRNMMIRGDAVQELENLDDGSIDVVITDPPYGQDYISHRSKFKDHVTKKGVTNDNEDAFIILEKSCEILNRKMKKDSHLYVFCSWKVESRFSDIISKYFSIKNVIIWDKGVHGAGDLEYAWGNQYEMIIFATKGSRPLNKRETDIIKVNKISSTNLIHPTQKPVEIIEKLLEVSGQIGDTICDPFMGVGSTVRAVKNIGNMNYIGIEIDNDIFEKAKVFIND